MLDGLVKLRDKLGYTNAEVDINSLFTQKLLENKMASAVQQLIVSDLIPFEDLELGIMNYLSEEYCLSEENFY